MAMTQPEVNGFDTRWQVTAGDNRHKLSKLALIHLIALELVASRHSGITTNQFDTALADALAYVNSKTEDARGIRN